MRIFPANAGYVTEVDGAFTFTFNSADRMKIMNAMPGVAVPSMAMPVKLFCNPTCSILPVIGGFIWPEKGCCWPTNIPHEWTRAWQWGGKDQKGALGDWEVVGPEGELYGRYKTYPTPDQIPLYALVKKVELSPIFQWGFKQIPT